MQSSLNKFVISFLLVALTVTVYVQTVNHSFVNLDDEVYVTVNPHVTSGITVKNIAWAFTSVEAANWHPFTWLSHMVDVQLFGVNPGYHHLTNVLIHTITSVLLLFLLLRLTGALWRSSFVAALFALHPVHVESVAWVAERKDLLSGFFWFLTIFSYANYIAKPNRNGYVVTLVSFIVGLMCKPMLVTLPVIMLLLDYWPLDRYHRFEGCRDRQQVVTKQLIWEKVPFFLASLISGVITIYAQHAGGATQSLDAIPLMIRLQNAIIAYASYIGKMLWPVGLSVFYPYGHAIPLWQIVCSSLILFLISGVTIRYSRRRPYLAVGWFWFIITLIPVIGLIQVGSQSMADRYSYIPLTGLFILLSWGVPELLRGMPRRKNCLIIASATVITASCLQTWKQVGYWQNDETLFKHSLEVTSSNDFVHNLLGMAFDRNGEPDAAITEYYKALQINPNNYEAHSNLGLVLERKGDLSGAMRHYRDSVRLNPAYDAAHNNLGVVLAKIGDLEAAVNEFKTVVQINPNSIKGIRNLAMALDNKGELDEAVRAYRKVVAISPDKDAHKNLGLIYLAKKEWSPAVTELRMALTIDPNDLVARSNLGSALINVGDVDGAIDQYRTLIAISPGDVDGHKNLGVASAIKGDFETAIRELKQAQRLDPINKEVAQNLERALEDACHRSER